MNTFLHAMESQLIGHKIIFEVSNRQVALATPTPPSSFSDDEIEALKERLRDCMPLDGMITDLWDWDLRFEELLEDDWYYAAIFGDVSEVDYCAELLAEFFLEKCNEYEMDYNRHSDPEWFEGHVLEQANKFLLGWRRKVNEKYGFGMK